jgi:hypothetical protein
MRKQLLKKLTKDIEQTSVYRMHKRTGINYQVLRRVYRGISKGSITTWERLNDYYGKS